MCTAGGRYEIVCRHEQRSLVVGCVLSSHLGAQWMKNTHKHLSRNFSRTFSSHATNINGNCRFLNIIMAIYFIVGTTTTGWVCLIFNVIVIVDKAKGSAADVAALLSSLLHRKQNIYNSLRFSNSSPSPPSN